VLLTVVAIGLGLYKFFKTPDEVFHVNQPVVFTEGPLEGCKGRVKDDHFAPRLVYLVTDVKCRPGDRSPKMIATTGKLMTQDESTAVDDAIAAFKARTKQLEDAHTKASCTKKSCELHKETK
jgi:hypothetical protein